MLGSVCIFHSELLNKDERCDVEYFRSAFHFAVLKLLISCSDLNYLIDARIWGKTIVRRMNVNLVNKGENKGRMVMIKRWELILIQ